MARTKESIKNSNTKTVTKKNTNTVKKAAQITKGITKPKVTKTSTKKTKRNTRTALTDPAITRIARRAGVMSITPSAKDVVRESIDQLTKEIVDTAVYHMQLNNRKTLMPKDIKLVLHEKGYVIADSTEKKGIKYDKFNGFETYIKQLVKVSNAEISINSSAAHQMNALLHALGHSIADYAQKTIHADHKSMMKPKHILYSISVVMGADLSDNVIKFVETRIKNYESSKMVKGVNIEASKKRSARSRAGLIIPPSRCNQFLAGCMKRGMLVRIALTSALEYVAKEVLSLAGNGAIENKKKRISPVELKTVVMFDESLKNLVDNKLGLHIVNAGFENNIRQGLLPKQGVKRGKPGSVALKTVRSEQKSTKNAMRKATYERYLKSFAPTGSRVSEKAVIEMQHYTESVVFDILKLSQDITLNAARTRVSDKDVTLSKCALKI